MDGNLDQLESCPKEVESACIADDSTDREERLDQDPRRGIQDRTEGIVNTRKDTETKTNSPIPPPNYRHYLHHSISVGSVLPPPAGQEPWHEHMSNADVLPEQFFSPLKSFATVRPEAALMQAVLEDALTCFQKQFEAEGRRIQRMAREAEQWLLNDDAHWPFSFVSICGVLGLEPTAIRRELQRWSYSHHTMPQRKRRRVVRRGRQTPTLAV